MPSTPYNVWTTRVGRGDLDALRGRTRDSARAKLRELEQRGCHAAGYRLQGLPNRVCAVAIGRDWRLLTAFPADREVCVLLVGRHSAALGTQSVYHRYYRTMGIEPPYPTGDPAHPDDCCDGELTPLEKELPEQFIQGAKRLAKQERRPRRSGDRGRRRPRTG